MQDFDYLQYELMRLDRICKHESREVAHALKKIFWLSERLKMEVFHNRIHRQHVIERIIIHLIRYDPIFKLPHTSCDPTFIRRYYKKILSHMENEFKKFISISFNIRQSFRGSSDSVNKVIQITIQTKWGFSKWDSYCSRHNSSYKFSIPFQTLVNNEWVDCRPRKTLLLNFEAMDSNSINNSWTMIYHEPVFYAIGDHYSDSLPEWKEHINNFHKNIDLGLIIDHTPMFTYTIRNEGFYQLKLLALRSYFGEKYDSWFDKFELECKVLSIDIKTVQTLIINLVIEEDNLAFRLYGLDKLSVLIFPNSFFELPISELVFSGIDIDLIPDIERLTSLKSLVFINCRIRLPFLRNSRLAQIKFIRCVDVELATRPDFPMLERVYLIDGVKSIDFFHPNKIIIIHSFEDI